MSSQVQVLSWNFQAPFDLLRLLDLFDTKLYDMTLVSPSRTARNSPVNLTIHPKAQQLRMTVPWRGKQLSR
jgi:hypothetical protein